MRGMLYTMGLLALVGCRTQTTAMTNPFLAPDKVPPPATRTLLPGTAQPYYPGDPVPNSPAIQPPPSYAPVATPNVVPAPVTPGAPLSSPAYMPQTAPAGTVPPGGWNTTPQPYPSGASYNVVPGAAQSTNGMLSTDPNILPTTAETVSPGVIPGAVMPASAVSPYPNQVVAAGPNVLQAQYTQPVVATGPQRGVQLRAISSEHLNADGTRGDGFRPQGSTQTQTRKPPIISRLLPKQSQPSSASSDHFGFDPQYQWLRGQLQRDPSTGQLTLRYADAGSKVDELGGAMLIANPEVLGSLQPGEFVQLRGNLAHVPTGYGFDVPAYTVAVVQRQRI